MLSWANKNMISSLSPAEYHIRWSMEIQEGYKYYLEIYPFASPIMIYNADKLYIHPSCLSDEWWKETGEWFHIYEADCHLSSKSYQHHYNHYYLHLIDPITKDHLCIIISIIITIFITFVNLELQWRTRGLKLVSSNRIRVDLFIFVV